MDDVGTFLAYAIRLEEDAAQRFADLAEAMKIYGNADVAQFFARMAQFSRMHLEEARKRAAFHTVPSIPANEFCWPGDESPEATSMEGSHYLMTLDYAFDLALESEERGYAFYATVFDRTTDSDVKVLAREFRDEEAEHVAELKRWMTKLNLPAAAA
ncbi:MAG: rubrerythrin [Alphaproteobacteria bacterium]|nr:MAG: rubrerythrin [Alphaproteobacteria bacterium]